MVLLGGDAPYISLYSSHLCTATRGTKSVGDTQMGITQAPGKHSQRKASVLQVSCIASQPDLA